MTSTGTSRIALVMGQDIAYSRNVMRGVQAFAQAKPNWILRDGPLARHVIRAVKEWSPHGVIAHLYDRKLSEAIGELGVPLVNTTNTLTDLNHPLVEADHEAVGAMAADYFLGRGFRHFGFFGSRTAGFSIEREAGFRSALLTAGHELSACHAEYLPRPSASASWVTIDSRVRAWLAELPKPVAILSSNDVPARELADICRQLGFDVPNQVSLLGVDNDELECNLSTPPLSSVVLPAQRIGFEAASQLERLMRGERLAELRYYLPPVRIESRLSTDTLAIEDDDLRAALAFIRRVAHEDLDVSAVCTHVAISRRLLERKFRSLLGGSILQEIRRTRVDIAKRLLAETDLPLPGVAKRSGFSGARRLAVVFREELSTTPSAFRDAIRGARPLPQTDT